MNDLLNKWERKIGRYAISNLSMWIIVAYVIGYMLFLFAPILLSFCTMNPYAILHGQIWRLVTWVFIPPGGLNMFTVLMLFFYYSIGSTLERTWGTFRYNVYIFSGMLFSVLGGFLVYFLDCFIGAYNPVSAASIGTNLGAGISTYYINLSIFLAFAACYPDMQVLLYFIVPVKIKWLAYLDVALLAYSFFTQGRAHRMLIIASLLNFILFFLGTRNFRRVTPKEIHRRRTYQQQVRQPRGITKHKCAICGRTEDDDPNLEFRFCSKCDGNYEYCQDHLFTHEHIHGN